MGLSQSSSSSSKSSKIQSKGECLFEYNGEKPKNELQSKINIDEYIQEAQFVIRPMVNNSLGLFTHWAWLFKLEYNLVSIEYGSKGVVVKVYFKDDYNNAYCGLMGDSAKIYWKAFEDFESNTFAAVLSMLEDIIENKGYTNSAYNVKTKSCQTFVHDLAEDFVSSDDFPWVYPLEYDYKVKATIVKLMGLNDLKLIPNRYFPNPIPKWLAYSNHSLQEQKRMVEEVGIKFDEKHFNEYTINIS